MKRTISLLLCLFLIAALCTGCSFSSGKGGKDEPAAENAADKDVKEPAADTSDADKSDEETPAAEDPSPAKEDAETAEPADTHTVEITGDASLPEIEIPLEDDDGTELFDPAELPDDSGDPGFTPDEDLITGNDDVYIDENGDTVLPEVP